MSFTVIPFFKRCNVKLCFWLIAKLLVCLVFFTKGLQVDAAATHPPTNLSRSVLGQGKVILFSGKNTSARPELPFVIRGGIRVDGLKLFDKNLLKAFCGQAKCFMGFNPDWNQGRVKAFAYADLIKLTLKTPTGFLGYGFMYFNSDFTCAYSGHNTILFDSDAQCVSAVKGVRCLFKNKMVGLEIQGPLRKLRLQEWLKSAGMQVFGRYNLSKRFAFKVLGSRYAKIEPNMNNAARVFYWTSWSLLSGNWFDCLLGELSLDVCLFGKEQLPKTASWWRIRFNGFFNYSTTKPLYARKKSQLAPTWEEPLYYPEWPT